MKIDIAKAFDSVHWPFLLNTLRALNMLEEFVHWIELCVCSPSFSVQVNGELAGFFQSRKGLRQGCALSPYLFVICMNVLSSIMDKAAARGIIGYHPKCQNILLTHLCFADDLLVFTDGTKRSIENVLKIFEDFAAISGLKISLEKSTLFTAGLSDIQARDILTCFPFASGKLPVRYLSLPLLSRKMTINDYMPLVQKIRKKMSYWTGRLLSYGGRLQLISSVITSVANFWLSAFRLPSSCLKEIERLCSAFLWSWPDLKTSKAKLCWQDVCLPKKEGCLKDLLGVRGTIGLGITEHASVEEVMLYHRKRRHRLAILNTVEGEIEELKSRRSEDDDIPLWRQDETRFTKVFSTKKTWLYMRQEQPVCTWNKRVWFSRSTPKYSFMLWVAVKNRLQTCDRMKKWNTSINGVCVLCQEEEETCPHLFFKCRYLRKVWKSLIGGIMKEAFSLEWSVILDLISQSSSSFTPSEVFIIRYIFQALLHSIWRERNARRHGEQPRDELLLIKWVDKVIRLKLLAVKGTGQIYLEEGLSVWFGSRVT
ncbi:uncharacterized protein LOC125608532 [Brassica napus]|uniref:uncharacterized protein LOC125608532 n=1 Tax=Brassica napus TaxID=3708 RepID=UPI00207901C1|nr:uncharacterized protein LOC125608532 [Brassica napus]